MHSPDDELDELLGAIDPTRDEAPPTRGSDRYRSIREHAMTTTDHDHETDADTAGTGPLELVLPPPTDPGGGRGRRWLLGAAAAALVLGVVGSAVVLAGSDESEPASSTSSTSSIPLDEVTSLRGEMTLASQEGSTTSSISFDGESSAITSESTYSDTRSEASTLIWFGGFEYETIDGTTTRRPLAAGQRLAPFATASRNVVKTLLANSDRLDEGDDTVDGFPTTRHQLAPTPQLAGALAVLQPSELAWFDLESPDQLEQITIWVGDDDRIIRRLESSTGSDGAPGASTTTSIRFFDFNQPIRIDEPTGPFVEAEG